MDTLYGRDGWGSVLVEAQYAWYGRPLRVETVGDLFQSSEARDALARVNPLSQIPTLVLADGTVMTESVAITLLLADMTGETSLVPPPGDPDRPAFLRWLVFLVTNIYPTFTYADDPERFCPPPCADGFRDNVRAYRQRLWGIVHEACAGPWMLGGRLTALDLFVAVMTHWTPKPDWFAAHAPRLDAIRRALRAEPRLQAILARHFPEGTTA